MGRYIQRQDIEDVCGATNVAAWSDVESDQAAGGEARVQRAIAWAEDYVDSRFAGSRYALPLRASGGGGVPAQVRDWAAWLAGWWLRQPREADPQRRAEQIREVERQIECVLRGQVTLAAEQAAPGRGPQVV